LFAIGAATYVGGQWLNENTPIQSWISSGLDVLTGNGGGGGGGGGRFVYENLSD
jgi:hypothetical protein